MLWFSCSFYLLYQLFCIWQMATVTVFYGKILSSIRPIHKPEWVIELMCPLLLEVLSCWFVMDRDHCLYCRLTVTAERHHRAVPPPLTTELAHIRRSDCIYVLRWTFCFVHTKGKILRICFKMYYVPKTNFSIVL